MVPATAPSPTNSMTLCIFSTTLFRCYIMATYADLSESSSRLWPSTNLTTRVWSPLTSWMSSCYSSSRVSIYTLNPLTVLSNSSLHFCLYFSTTSILLNSSILFWLSLALSLIKLTRQWLFSLLVSLPSRSTYLSSCSISFAFLGERQRRLPVSVTVKLSCSADDHLVKNPDFLRCTCRRWSSSQLEQS